MIYIIQPCVFLIYVHYNSEIMGRLKIDTYAHTSIVQEIANPYAPDLSVSTKPGHES